MAIMALSSTFASASDPSPLQDLCVAINDSKFVFILLDVIILLTPRNTSNLVGSTVTLVNVMQIPSLNTFGISLARIDFAPYGLNPSTHTLVELKSLVPYTYVDFVTSNLENRLFTRVLYPGDVFVFPEGLIQFQFNKGETNAVAIASLSSQNTGVITIYDDVLTKAFQVDKKVVDYLQAQFWWPNN
ncbi:hypothetical protein HYC85_013066 [Camellia sinensis]|uniref:Germin-like protein n=1 Tax=Camellia sinensis TaxID=4442 RepID=A0A7J7HDU5_CAMSI|nr:hypothetical protein HYC85_013066 [Camellia sinensis]